MYQVKFYKGDYSARQRAANADGCVAYVEHHFNSSAGAAGNYAAVIVGANASNTSKNWARWYAQAVGNSFGIGLGDDQGVVVGGYGGRGDGNVKLTDMPAILVEPLFANNPAHAEWIRSAAGQERLARILAASIQRCFPNGGLIGFSVGHKYKTSSPNDRGAAVHGGGTQLRGADRQPRGMALRSRSRRRRALGRDARDSVHRRARRAGRRHRHDAATCGTAACGRGGCAGRPEEDRGTCARGETQKKGNEQTDTHPPQIEAMARTFVSRIHPLHVQVLWDESSRNPSGLPR